MAVEEAPIVPAPSTLVPAPSAIVPAPSAIAVALSSERLLAYCRPRLPPAPSLAPVPRGEVLEAVPAPGSLDVAVLAVRAGPAAPATRLTAAVFAPLAAGAATRRCFSAWLRFAARLLGFATRAWLFAPRARLVASLAPLVVALATPLGRFVARVGALVAPTLVGFVVALRLVAGARRPSSARAALDRGSRSVGPSLARSGGPCRLLVALVVLLGHGHYSPTPDGDKAVRPFTTISEPQSSAKAHLPPFCWSGARADRRRAHPLPKKMGQKLAFRVGRHGGDFPGPVSGGVSPVRNANFWSSFFGSGRARSAGGASEASAAE